MREGDVLYKRHGRDRQQPDVLLQQTKSTNDMLQNYQQQHEGLRYLPKQVVFICIP